MKRFFRNNGLSIVMFGLFAFSLTGQFFTGYQEYKEERQQHGQPAVDRIGYISDGHFIEAVFENWESEFLQMAAYVLLTIFLFQKGSSESKDPGRTEAPDVIPKNAKFEKDSPLPVKRGGLALLVYQNSLSLAFVFLFIFSFVLHAYGGARVFSQEELAHGGTAVTTFEYMGTSRFWFESFQNWQSEFLSMGAMIVLSIFLRQKGSPESKPVAASYDETGVA